MKLLTKTILLIASSILIYCNTIKENKTDVVALSRQVVGIYEASLPCINCIRIEYQLEIQSDSTFIEHITFLGTDGNYEVHGRWSADADSVLILNPGRLAHKIKVNANGSLIIIDAIENHLEQQPAILMRLGTSSKTNF
jgi:NlpE N-terminal domain